MLKLRFSRQHGAWAILVTSSAVGAAITGVTVPGILLFVAAVMAFIACDLVQANISRFAKGTAEFYLCVITSVSLALMPAMLLLLHYNRWAVAPMGLAAIFLAVAAIIIERRTKGKSHTARFLQVMALAIIAPATVYASNGIFTWDMAGLWILMCLVLCGSVLNVRCALGRFENGGGWVKSIAYHLSTIILACGLSIAGLIPAFGAVATLPGFARSVWRHSPATGARPRAKAVGVAELAYTGIIAIIIVAAWKLPL